MPISHTFEKCPFCQCNSKGISIVLCGNSQCRKIFCSVCGEIYLSPHTEQSQKITSSKEILHNHTMAGCIHCWTVRPLLWKATRGEPQIGIRDSSNQPIERQHIRLGEIQ